LLLVLGVLAWPTAAGASAQWSVSTIPPPAAGTSQYQLQGVSCASKTNCFAVGSFVDGSSITHTLIEHWNGSAWTVVPNPSVGSGNSGALTAVSCAGAANCFAVGTTSGVGGNRTLFEHWDGTTWHITPSPNPASLYDITGVSCVGPAFCVAVGDYSSPTTHTLIERWNGSHWTIVPSPGGLADPELSAVSCAGANSCIAVGDNADGIGRTLVEHWNGANWAIVPSPNPGGTNSNLLWGVACASTTSCYAVGTDFIGGKARTLIERWNGTHVTIVSNPPPVGNEDELKAVSCTSVNSCVAVGLIATPSALRTLAERWDGVSWTRVASADAGATTGDELVAVSCVTATYCFSVGDYMHTGTHHALIERLSLHVGYWMVDQSGQLYDFGDAGVTTPQFPARPVAMAAVGTTRGQAYWIVDANGTHVQGGLLATTFDAPPPLLPGEVVSAISGTPSARGYWLFTNFGHVYAYGDAHFYGDMGNARLNGPIVASAPTPTGHGYYLVGSDGGVFTFGDARFHGSTGGMHLNKPVIGIVPTSDNNGYWLVASDGGVFAFHAAFHGSMGGMLLNRPIVGMVAYGNGYLMVGSDGGIFDFSNEAFVGSLGDHPPAAPIVGVAAFVD